MRGTDDPGVRRLRLILVMAATTLATCGEEHAPDQQARNDGLCGSYSFRRDVPMEAPRTAEERHFLEMLEDVAKPWRESLLLQIRSDRTFELHRPADSHDGAVATGTWSDLGSVILLDIRRETGQDFPATIEARRDGARLILPSGWETFPDFVLSKDP